ncbi:MAG: sulfotransferase domain-containing protein [Methylococcales bacterium]
MLRQINHLKLLARAARKIANNPALFREALVYARNDLLSWFGVYRYDYPVIFIAGLPKSGTTWLETQLVKVLGYNLRPINDPQGVTLNHDICESVFSWLPEHGYSLIKLHTRYTDENFRIITKYCPKFIVMIRDLRDMCVSGYFHVKNNPEHCHYALYNQESIETGLLHRIEITGHEYVPWVRNWLRVAEQHPNEISLIRYEDLNKDPFTTFQKALEFYHLPVNEDFLQELENSKLKEQRDLKNELTKNTGSRLKSTARKGIVGDWHNYFTEANKAKFKQMSGDILVESGYEKDNNW